MKVATLENFLRKEDVQIQSATHQLGFSILGTGNPYDVENEIKVRLRLVSPAGGTRTIIDRMPLTTLLEICASGEGFFEMTTLPDDAFRIVGLVEICRQGALDLGVDGYLSLDVDSPVSVARMEIFALDAPLLSKQFVRYDPTSINGVTKEINLVDTIGIALRPVDISSISVQFPSRTVEYDKTELIMTGNNINDIVSFNRSNNTVLAGVVNYVQLDVPASNRCTVTPQGSGQFYIYLIKEQSL